MAAGVSAWLAMDSDEAWHLLIEVPPGGKRIQVRPTKGLEVRTEEMVVGEESPAFYIDLVCLHTAFRRTFLYVADGILKSVNERPSAPKDAVLQNLQYWRRFWSSSAEALSQEAALGLFGELWFMERWIGLPQGLNHWVGPSGSVHDFRWDEFSVEVKATRVGSQTPAIHRITSLEQLAVAAAQRLYLFSLRVSPDEGAANNLPSLVERIREAVQPYPDILMTFLDRLAESGYSPSHADSYSQCWRVLAEDLYEVGEEFPRLTSESILGGVPNGVVGISYSVVVDACSPWRIATHPSSPVVEFLRT